MQELQANTEVKVRIGPFVDVGDGFTPQTDIALSCNEAELLKHNGVATVDISGSTWAAVTNCRGWYDLTLTATDTNTEGLLTVVVQDDSDCLPVYAHFMVLAQAAWLSKYTAKDSGLMGIDVVNIAGAAVATGSAQLGVNVVNIGASAAAGVLETAVDNGLDNAIGASPTADSVAQRIKALDLLTEASGAGDLAAILTDTETTIPGTITTLTTNVGTVDTVVDGIKSVTDNLPDSGALTTINGYVDCLPASLNNISTAEVNAEVDTALSDINLDHLCKTATGAADMTTEVADNTILSRILANGDTSAFVPSTDGLQLIRDELVTVDGNVDSILTDTAAIDGHITADYGATEKTNINHITADYAATEKSAIDLLDDAGIGLQDLHDDHCAYITAAIPTAAQINAEIVDVIRTDAISELSQATPTATPTVSTALMLLYMTERNKLTTTATELGIYNDAGTKIAKKTLSDDGTTYTETEMVSG